MWRLPLVLWFSLVTLHAASAARWFDSLPADDPDMVVRRDTAKPTVQPAQQPPAAASLPVIVANGAASVVVGAYIVTTGLFLSVAGGVDAIASGTGEALYETAYMFGINRTPVPRTAIVDPIPDIKVRPDDAAPAIASSHIPRSAAAMQIASNDQTAIASASPVEPAPNIAASAAKPAAESERIDPGLLANFIYDRGARRPDGSFFVPKPLQRLFEVRTAATVAAEVPVELKPINLPVSCWGKKPLGTMTNR